MVGEILPDNWLVNLWKSSLKSISREPESPVLGIMAFEISRLMSKVVSLWQSLTDAQIARLRDEISNSVGIRKLVSENESDLMDLAFSEIIENLKTVSSSVAMLGKKCADPVYHDLDRIFNGDSEIDPKRRSWQFKVREMEKKVKKMEIFVGATEQLYQEIEVLAELEQSLRRMRVSSDVKALEFQQKVLWQRQEVKNLRETSPWVRTYDYVVCLLSKSIFTITERVKCVYGRTQQSDSCLVRGNSLRQTMSVHPSETNSFGRSFSSLGLVFPARKTRLKNARSSHSRSQSFIFCGNQNPAKDAMQLKDIVYGTKSQAKMSSFLDINFRPLVDARPSTVGHAGLATRYANIIILIEKLASSPELISRDARSDLYHMLPESIRSRVRRKLKTFSGSLGSCVNSDDGFAGEWRLAVGRILEWVSPLAHDMMRWHSERNFERQRLSFGSGVRLVQTLYFADRVGTEEAVVELLVGLNYLYRVGMELSRGTVDRAFLG